MGWGSPSIAVSEQYMLFCCPRFGFSICCWLLRTHELLPPSPRRTRERPKRVEGVSQQYFTFFPGFEMHSRVVGACLVTADYYDCADELMREQRRQKYPERGL